ncbi:hypothetical protein DHEL01_v208061 [Diaporthe helianthi]|uniref:Uncharacterized protein n=1 Tax=Diaporthe helianthi TaxID=158607 RepID=A0A2P5HTG8_DIAHE|nr:hypothetical protein DHEL01_v208061 [Diaporthe helianthi]
MSSSTSPAANVPANHHSRTTLEGLPPELRLIIYKYHFSDMIDTMKTTSREPFIRYHFCDKKYEIVQDLDRFREKMRSQRFLAFVCVGPLFRQEAEPVLYDYFTFSVSLRQHWTPLDLSEGDRYMLSHASKLQLHLTNDYICRIVPTQPWGKEQSLYRKVRRGSWHAGSASLLDKRSAFGEMLVARPRGGSWSGPAPMPPYIDRVDVLFDALGRGIYLKSLIISISDFDHEQDNGAIGRQLDRRIFDRMLSHIEARLSLNPENCVAILHLHRRIGHLLSTQRVRKFLFEIQQ